MKILQMSEHYLPFYGGVEIGTHEISRRLVRKGFEVEVVCEREKGTLEQEVIDGVKIRRFPGFEPIQLKYHVGRASPKMLVYAISSNSDVIHAHSYGFFPTWISLLTKKPTIITTHSDPTAKIYGLWDLFRELPIKMCNHVIATTKMEKRHLVRRGITPEKISVIPNGITLPPPDAPAQDISPTIFCLARMDLKHKGQDVLVKAMAQVLSAVPEAKLVIAGSGDDLGKIKQITCELNIEKNVFFEGSIDQDTKNFYMKNCDVFCVSPRTESFGIVYLEAMAYGKPIVTTNVGGIAEVLSDCAVLVPPNNPSLLAKELIEVLGNGEKARKLGTKALDRVKMFDWDVIVERYKKLYTELIKKERSDF
jgi:glycosyltransferase involved in cell wall biosynthesis